MNATSAYSIFYDGLSPEDRARIETDLSEIIDKILKQELPVFSVVIGKAVEQMVLQVGLWKEWVTENNRAYDFISVLQKSIWEGMMNTNPKEVGEWDMRYLVKAWREKFPTEFAEIVNAENLRTIEELTKSLEFERSINRRY
jgi:Tfp pilus assembly pilus retraction ATPase PilT